MTNNIPEIFSRILSNLELVIHGKHEVLSNLLVSYFAGGHILLNDVPGVGKTTLAKALAISVNVTAKRIQFTPDLLPADITGSMIYNTKTSEFTFRKGPIFSDIFLADEINRASPRTQSALLEAMNEWQVTIDGKTMALGNIFTVIATQNPIAFHGTYPLPEAQLDRFYMSLTLGYPKTESEKEMLTNQRLKHPIETLKPVTNRDEVLKIREEIKNVKASEGIADYILDIVNTTREDPRIKLGISPRGSLALYKMAQAKAWSKGRNYVLPDDIKELAPYVLAHRIMLDTKVRHSGITKESIVKDILNNIEVRT